AIVRLGHRKVLMEGVCRAVQREPLLPTGLLPKINRRVAAYLNKKMHPSREVGRFDNGQSLVATG
ncbi:hypothetical protein CGZ80_23195, partial [Rhodopirellula sp. MGV]